MEQSPLLTRWHWLWRQLGQYRERRNVDGEASAAAELVNTASLIRARIRNRRRRTSVTMHGRKIDHSGNGR
jgi:hypothetical protein